ncbi:MAG TPA: DUF1175 family protein [Holophagaceae bacterium]|nr:DUF1175 family protein [Holophagaceae bacterium]
MRILLSVALAGAAAALAVAPVRHCVRLEAAEGNPIQRVVVDSRSLFGIPRPAWGARVTGIASWGSAREGFFLSPSQATEVEVQAWPGFRERLELRPSGSLEGTAIAWDEGDRQAFRRWFVAILEDQLERLSPAWEPAQRDCAGLLRFAFHEAWGPKDALWRQRLSFTGTFVAKVPSAALAGPWREGFPTPAGWAPFAKGAFLRDYACVRLGREPMEAQPGDLLFFSRADARKTPDHAMAFGRPDPDGMPVLIYHTGAEGSAGSRDAGAMRRVRLSDLLQHPDPAFRPQPENPAFLGVYRWKVLADS